MLQVMESIFARHMITAPLLTSPIKYPENPFQIRRTFIQIPHLRFSVSSKQSHFQEFESYAKPSRLLQAKEVKLCTEFSPEKTVTSFGVDGSQCLYKVKLHTSSMYGSGLSDLNAGVLLCLIDENGYSLLQRIPASSMKDYHAQSENDVLSDELHFQRGSVDEFIFEGSQLGTIGALWIGIESGQWRLGGVSLTVICGNQTSPEEISYSGLKYNFEVEDLSLGEGSEISMTELRPCVITQLSGVDPFTLLSKTLSQSTPLAISNEESMREYADLKFSLLLYDSMLILLGTSIANFSAGDNAAIAFLAGGVVGFSYLLLLQRSVDGLPAPAPTSINSEGNFSQMFGGFKSPVTGLALAIGIAVVALKYGSEDVALILTPKYLLVGMLGFLACKVAVVLAAFNPVPLSLKENE